MILSSCKHLTNIWEKSKASQCLSDTNICAQTLGRTIERTSFLPLSIKVVPGGEDAMQISYIEVFSW
jgi:hypothetical protein